MAIDFGLSTLSRGVLVSREAYLSVAQAAERAGFGFLSVNDHIIVPGTLGSAYPYTQGGAWAAAEHGHCFDQLATLAFLAGCTSPPAAADLCHGGAAPARHLHRQDARHHRRALRRPPHPRRRRRLDEGGVRAARRPLRGARRGDGRVPRGLQGAVDPGAAVLQRQARALRRRHLRAQADAEAASAHLGRRREPGRAAPYRQARRCLVSRQQQPDQAARHPGAARAPPSAGCTAWPRRPAATQRRSPSA